MNESERLKGSVETIKARYKEIIENSPSSLGNLSRIIHTLSDTEFLDSLLKLPSLWLSDLSEVLSLSLALKKLAHVSSR